MHLQSSSSVYDNDLRKKKGSYYTPPEVVRVMVRLADEALQSGQRFALPEGLAATRLFVTDTLGNPYAEEEYLPHILLPLGESRRRANAIKKRPAASAWSSRTRTRSRPGPGDRLRLRSGAR